MAGGEKPQAQEGEGDVVEHFQRQVHGDRRPRATKRHAALEKTT
jgi:hypothetical protein